MSGRLRESTTSAWEATSTESKARRRDSRTCRISRLTAELIRRGYSDADIKKILSGNMLRVMREVEKVSAKLQKERLASPSLMPNPGTK